jgi:hypothetical protein
LTIVSSFVTIYDDDGEENKKLGLRHGCSEVIATMFPASH